MTIYYMDCSNQPIMKKPLFLLLLAVCLQSAFAQDCAATYGVLKAGTRLEYTNFNKKGEADLIIKQLCKQVESRGDTLVAEMAAQGTDAKGKETFARSFSLKCLAGIMYMNMQSLLPTQAGGSPNPGLEMEMEGGDLAYPADMQPGQTLSDAEMTVKTSTGGFQLMKMRYLIGNRRVVGAEQVTTKAGTFDCLKITYDLEMNLLGRKTYQGAQWVAKNVGMVKTENYDKKGAVESSMQLTAFQK